jgi:hypothetical protein
MSEPGDLNRLRAGFAQVDDPQPAHGCPSISEIWEGVHGELPAGRLREVVEHLASCAPCAEAWRVALILERPPAADPLAEEMPAAHTAAGRQAARLPRLRRRRFYATLAAAAAVAVLAVAIGIYPSLHRGDAPALRAQLRGTAADQAQGTRWLTPDRAVLPRGDARLRWSGAPGTTYDVTVDLEDESGTAKPIPLAAARGLTATGYTLPAPALARAPAGFVPHATLVAHLADGRIETLSLDFRLQ